MLIRRQEKQDGRLRHLQLITDRALPQEVEPDGEEDDGTKANAKRSRRETIKGVLFHDYCWQTHQFITHLRRVHPGNPSIVSNIQGNRQINWLNHRFSSITCTAKQPCTTIIFFLLG